RARAARWPDLDAEASEVAGPLARYEAAMRKLDLVDLDDLLAVPVMLLAGDEGLAGRYRERFGFVAVDEYQDVDELQYRLLRLLTGPGANLCVIGDPDQAIYGFRGADVGFFLRFAQDFPAATTVRLSRNYRSSPAIVAGALQAIAPSTLVAGRQLAGVAGREAAARITIHQTASDLAEAEFVVQTVDRLLGGASFLSLDSGRADGGAEHGLSFADVAVLYRTDAQSGPLAEALGRAGMPFQKRSHDRLAYRPAVRALVRAMREQPPAGDRSLAARLAAAAAAGATHAAVPGALALPRPPAAPLRGRPGPVPGRAGPGGRGRHLGPAGRPGVAADPARRQGAGVPGGGPNRLRGRAAALGLRPPADPGRDGRGAAAVLRRHDPGPPPPVSQPRPPARLAGGGT